MESGATESMSKHGMDLREIESKEMGSEQQLEEHRRLGGYKATLKNPRASQEAKEHAKEVLKDHDAI